MDTRHQHAWTRDGYGRDKCTQKENLREIVKIWFLKSYGTQSPLLSSEISMVVLFTGPSCGVLVTKLAIRSVMMLGFCILCAGLISTLYVPSYHYLFICFFIMGKESRGANNKTQDRPNFRHWIPTFLTWGSKEIKICRFFMTSFPRMRVGWQVVLSLKIHSLKVYAFGN